MVQSLQLCAILYLDFLLMLNIEKKINDWEEKRGNSNTECKGFI